MRALWFLASAATLLRVVASTDTTAPFTYSNSSFLLHGEPYQIIGGQMDPQRVPNAYWRDRLSKARAMGLNTIFSYVFWDQIEPTKGAWHYTGNNDIASYFHIAQEEGLNVVLRPGPYICGEHEWGGFPAWLSEVPGMAVRTNNQPFLDASKSYIDRLAEELKPLLVTNGGPILMIQLENEYGSFGSDHVYVGALRDILKDSFKEMTLYTNDGGGQSYLVGGQLAGVLAETDGDPKTGFAARDEFVTDPSSLGPQLDGEYYVTWLDTWGSNSSYQTDVGNSTLIQGVQGDLDWILANNYSFSIYMFHGGTNWGFQNGGLWSNALTPVTTSYDYGAPLDESGRTNDVYHALRQTISKYLPNNASLPEVPEQSPLIKIPSLRLKPSVAMFDALPKAIQQKRPTNMEAVGQSHGLILYRHEAQSATQGVLKPGDAPRDRVLVYINGKRVGVIDSIYDSPNVVTLDIKRGDVLDLLVENMGRIDYGPKLVEQRKGIVGNVTVGESLLLDWNTYSLSLDQPPKAHSRHTLPPPSPDSAPIFYSGEFSTKAVGDTFLELPGWTKGVVWVNGVNLGRYWTVGPQQSLYLPGCYLHHGQNSITVLALEPEANATTVAGVAARKWGNNPDPDAPQALMSRSARKH